MFVMLKKERRKFFLKYYKLRKRKQVCKHIISTLNNTYKILWKTKDLRISLYTIWALVFNFLFSNLQLILTETARLFCKIK